MKRNIWLVTIVVFLGGVVLAAAKYKVSPTMVLLMDDLNVGLTLGGWLMSALTLSGIILAIPAGSIAVKIGAKRMALTALAFAAIGNAIGALAPNFSILMISRIIEGIGFVFIGVSCPAILAEVIPAEKRAVPMTLWSIWISCGMLFIFNITNTVVPSFGWRGDWWLITILSAIMFLLFTIVIKTPVPELKPVSVKDSRTTKSLFVGLKSAASWYLGVMFCMYSFGFVTFMTFVPTFLVEAVGMDLAIANRTSSTVTIGMIIGALLMGFVLSKVKNRFRLLIISMVLVGIVMNLSFQVTTPSIMVAFFFFVGLLFDTLPPLVWTLAPESAFSPKTIPSTMGIIIFSQTLGGFLAPIIVGGVVESSGGNWNAASIPLVIVAVIGIVFSILFNSAMNKKLKSTQTTELNYETAL